MADDNLSNSILELQNLITETRDAILASKKCPGCTFLDNIGQATRSQISNDDKLSDRQLKTEILQAQSLLLQAAKCRGILLNDPTKADNQGAKRNAYILLKNKSCQTSRRSEPNPKRSQNSSQTEISIESYQEIDKFYRRMKENDSSFTLQSFEQLLKLSATEREREYSISAMQFLKTFLQMSDDDYKIYYKKYLDGMPVDDLRRQWKDINDSEEKMEIVHDKDIDLCKKTIEIEKAKLNDDELDVLKERCAQESDKVLLLSNQLKSATSFVLYLMQVLAETDDDENLAQEGLARLLCSVGGYTELLNGRRKSA